MTRLRIALAALCAWLLAAPALAGPIPSYPNATVPLTGAESLIAQQNGVTVVMSVSQITASAVAVGYARADIPNITLGTNKAIVVSGYYARGDLGAGAMYYSGGGCTLSGTQAIADLGGTPFCLVTTGQVVNVGWFGAYGDYSITAHTGHDDTVAIKAAIATGQPIYVPHSFGNTFAQYYGVTQTIDVNNNRQEWTQDQHTYIAAMNTWSNASPLPIVLRFSAAQQRVHFAQCDAGALDGLVLTCMQWQSSGGFVDRAQGIHFGLFGLDIEKSGHIHLASFNQWDKDDAQYLVDGNFTAIAEMVNSVDVHMFTNTPHWSKTEFYFDCDSGTDTLVEPHPFSGRDSGKPARAGGENMHFTGCAGPHININGYYDDEGQTNILSRASSIHQMFPLQSNASITFADNCYVNYTASGRSFTRPISADFGEDYTALSYLASGLSYFCFVQNPNTMNVTGTSNDGVNTKLTLAHASFTASTATAAAGDPLAGVPIMTLTSNVTGGSLAAHSIIRDNPATLTATGTTHNLGTTVDSLSTNVLALGWHAGQSISGAGIPSGDTIASIALGGLSLVLASPATADAAGVTLTNGGTLHDYTSILYLLSGTANTNGAQYVVSHDNGTIASEAMTSTYTTDQPPPQVSNAYIAVAGVDATCNTTGALVAATDDISISYPNTSCVGSYTSGTVRYVWNGDFGGVAAMQPDQTAYKWESGFKNVMCQQSGTACVWYYQPNGSCVDLKWQVGTVANVPHLCLGNTSVTFGGSASQPFSIVLGDSPSSTITDDGNKNLQFINNGSVRWQVNSGGNFRPGSDNAYGIGSSTFQPSVVYSHQFNMAANGWESSVAPSIYSTTFGTSPTVAGHTADFRVNVGTGGTASVGTLTMPFIATTHWDCMFRYLGPTAAEMLLTTEVSSEGTTTASISSGTYNNSTGAVVLTLGTAANLLVGQTFNVSGLTGTGGFASLNGTAIVATAGSGGTTLNYTLAGAGASTITGGTVTFGTVTLTSYTGSTGVATAWPASAVLMGRCGAY